MCPTGHLPVKEFVPLDLVPVHEQHLFLSPLGQEVAPVQTGLLAVAPQLRGLAVVICHCESVHLQMTPVMLHPKSTLLFSLVTTKTYICYVAA